MTFEELKYKNCLFCEHFHFAPGSPDWSDNTPGIDIEIYCNKGVWDLDIHADTKFSFRRKMLTARSCDKYEERIGKDVR